MALGAGSRTVLRALLTSITATVLVGIVVGIAGAAAATRVASGFIYGITPLDPVSFGLAVLVLLAVSVAAATLPARRAVSVDPTEAMRAE